MDYSQNHPYQKDAKAFIRGLKKRQEYIRLDRELMKPIFDKFNVTNSWGVPEEYWSSIEWITSEIKKETAIIRGKHIRLNRRIDKLKYGYWAINPDGCSEYYSIYPEEQN